jgi:hypothetical protein
VSNPCGAAFAVQIGFPNDLSMLAITLTSSSTIRYGGKRDSQNQFFRATAMTAYGTYAQKLTMYSFARHPIRYQRLLVANCT